MYIKNVLKGSRFFRGLLCFSYLLVLPFFVFAQQQIPASLYEQTSEMGTTMATYQSDIAAIEDFYSPFITYPGSLYQRIAHVYKSPEQRKRLLEVNRNYSEQLKTLNFDVFSIYGKIDYLLLKKEISANVHLLTIESSKEKVISKFLPFAQEIYLLEKQRRRGDRLQGIEVAGQMNRLTADVYLAIKNFKLQGITEGDKRDLQKVLSGLKTRLNSFYVFYNGFDPNFTWWVPKPYESLDKALTDYERLLSGKEDELQSITEANNYGIKGLPVGKAELERQLQTEFIPYSPEDLIKIAEKEFAFCDAELLKASKEMGFGADWKQAQEKVKNSYVPLGEQPALIVKLQEEALSFIKANNLMEIPALANETWGMVMMSPERQLVNPFFTGGKEISISYPTNTMTQEDKLMSMRGNNPYFSRGTVQHELLPGHHLQYYMNSRFKNYRSMFTTPFSVEGWPLYWELLLYEKGFAKTPEERIGMLFWRMHRCARILFSLNYHLDKWTPKQCVDFLVDRVGHERANAEGEVRRSFQGDYSPLYQVAYMLGGLQITALRHELVDSGKMTFPAFHEAVMKENLIPVELIRATLTNQVLTRDFTTQWKFYNLSNPK
ncbi:X-Pro dipeptidyl-peptidase [Pedobacter antarcticus 4BY]|uniref:X-Pro dipeptidyl-peptidase n=2 Tax=Pedobacter antarcticus TaxID=34086 RepID=A0A081PD98_9SPHI|nr:DUF885 family protein [Pedobacter antarcticus]KEQ28671.1 X-Pro dipeptidyl-peptidase [Pedobacter antarcticus 4BY]SFE88470.1 protein of unknown function [Pedobacter antarcticus]